MDQIQNFVVNTLKIQSAEPKEQKKITLFLLISVGIFVFVGLFYLLMYSFTNYGSLGTLDKYIDQFKKDKKTEFFEDYSLGMKIMPSYNSEGNIIHMLHSKEVIYFYLI